jgi:hypothetical protein
MRGVTSAGARIAVASRGWPVAMSPKSVPPAGVDAIRLATA